jgi:hypothetical protein
MGQTGPAAAVSNFLTGKPPRSGKHDRAYRRSSRLLDAVSRQYTKSYQTAVTPVVSTDPRRAKAVVVRRRTELSRPGRTAVVH